VLSNDLLRAVFLTDFGGRLYSLTDLTTGRQLLFTNPVFQPCNLAIRDAWFAGGIEWNIGQYGHACSTCEPVLAGLVRETGDGIGQNGKAAALRIWQYERQRGLLWQIDFRLPPGQALLEAHVRIVNPGPVAVSLYWWTNTAVPQTDQTRVFSGTPEIIYQDAPAQAAWLRQHGGLADSAAVASAPVFFGHARLPFLTEDGQTFDATYPAAYSRASEYFFQNPLTDPAPWEACSQPDGELFFERSTQALRFRKMFCWGSHPGGRWWQDYLSTPGQSSYLELQAGLAPSQLHGARLAAGGEIEFTQVFGGTQLDPALAEGPWESAQTRIAAEVERLVPVGFLNQADADARCRARRQVADQDLLAEGTGWGALEAERRAGSLPEGFGYPASSLGAAQAPWLDLWHTGRMPVPTGQASYMVDPAWRPLLEGSLEVERQAHTLVHLGLLEWENLNPERAESLWREAAESGDPLAMRNLAQAAAARGQLDAGLEWLGRAWEVVSRRAGGDSGDDGGADESRAETELAYAEEYLALANAAGRADLAWSVFEGLTEASQTSEKISLQAGTAALALGKLDFVEALFDRPWAGLREGDNVLLDLWYGLQAARLAITQGLPAGRPPTSLLAEVRTRLTPPRSIDTRMYQG
jgi:hypothetical protein